MTPTGQPSISPDLAVTTATQDALRSLVANGTASSGTVTSVTADGLKLALAVVQPSNATHNGTTASFAVALPDSSTTVALALPTSLSGGAVAVVVTTVEVDASRFSSFGSSGGNGSSNSSATRPTEVLPQPTLVSSVVTIQVSQLSMNGTLTPTAVPYFETSVSVTRSNGTGTETAAVLAHNCSVGVPETVSLLCAHTAVRLNLTCSGRAAATVRRQCPVARAVCSVVDLADRRVVSSDFCRAVDLGSSVVCQCGGNGVNGSAIAAAGRVSVGVFQAYGAGAFTASVALATSLSASDVAARTVTMFATFGCVWGLGLLLLVALSWRRWTSEHHRSPSVQTEAGASSWVRLVLPAYYQSSVRADGGVEICWRLWVQQRWLQVLVANHPYLRVGRTLGRWWQRGNDGSDRTAGEAHGSDRIPAPVHGSDRTPAPVQGSDRTPVLADESHTTMLDVVHALTALTLACLLLAVLFDFQYPEDDGSCALQTTRTTCESRKMLLDPFESQCLWQPPPAYTAMDGAAAVLLQITGGRVVETLTIGSTGTHETPSCQFNGSNNSSLAFVVSYAITSAFAGDGALSIEIDEAPWIWSSSSSSSASSKKGSSTASWQLSGERSSESQGQGQDQDQDQDQDQGRSGHDSSDDFSIVVSAHALLDDDDDDDDDGVGSSVDPFGARGLAIDIDVDIAIDAYDETDVRVVAGT
eukprot:gene10173-biopygen4559